MVRTSARFASLATLMVAALAVPARPLAAAAAPGAEAAQSRPATRRSIALLSLELAGDAAGELPNVVSRSIERGLRGAGVTVIRGHEVDIILARTPELHRCLSSSCLGRIAELVGTGEFLRAHVSASGASYQIDLELLNPTAEGGLANRVERSCSVCTVTELSELVARSAAELVNTPADGIPVAIICHPAGATITIDGEVRGTAPYRGALAHGRHRIVARLDGYAASVKVIDVMPGDDEQPIELTLTPVAALSRPRPGFGAWKWVAAGGAAATLVTGAVLLAADGRGDCDASGPPCANFYDTGAAGWISLAVGAVAGGASAWMFVRDASRDHDD